MKKPVPTSAAAERLEAATFRLCLEIQSADLATRHMTRITFEEARVFKKHGWTMYRIFSKAYGMCQQLQYAKEKNLPLSVFDILTNDYSLQELQRMARAATKARRQL